MELDIVTYEQAKKLKDLGFDLKTVSDAYCTIPEYDGRLGNIFKSDMPYTLLAPTVALALKWIRKKYNMFHVFYVRSWDREQYGYSIGWHKLFMSNGWRDTSDLSDEEESLYEIGDGIASLDYDKANSIALTEALNYLVTDLYKYHSSEYCGKISWDEWNKKNKK